MNEVSVINKSLWGNLEPSDFTMPTVKIGQPTSSDSEPGHYNYNNGTVLKEILKCKLIMPCKTRVLYKTGDVAGLRQCWSDNYLKPSPRAEAMSQACYICPYSSWDPNPEKAEYFMKSKYPKKHDKPACNDTLSLIMADESNNPFLLQLSGVAVKIAKDKLLSRLRFGFSKESTYLVEFNLMLEKGDSSKGNYYIPKFDSFSVVSNEEDRESLKALFLSVCANTEDILDKVNNDNEERAVDDSVPF